jgi:hypothetical protein
MNRIEAAEEQLAAVGAWFARLAGTGERLRYDGATDTREKLAA